MNIVPKIKEHLFDLKSAWLKTMVCSRSKTTIATQLDKIKESNELWLELDKILDHANIEKMKQEKEKNKFDRGYAEEEALRRKLEMKAIDQQIKSKQMLAFSKLSKNQMLEKIKQDDQRVQQECNEEWNKLENRIEQEELKTATKNTAME